MMLSKKFTRNLPYHTSQMVIMKLIFDDDTILALFTLATL